MSAQPEKFIYYVTWVDQGPHLVFGSFVTKRDYPIETEVDVFELRRIAGAKDSSDKHIVVLDWKRIQ